MNCTIAGKWGQANLWTMWYHPISSEPVTKGQIKGIKMGDNGRFPPQTLGVCELGYVTVLTVLKITCCVPRYKIFWWSTLWKCSECNNPLWALMWFTRRKMWILRRNYYSTDSVYLKFVGCDHTILHYCHICTYKQYVSKYMFMAFLCIKLHVPTSSSS